MLAGKQAILDREHAVPRCARRLAAAGLAQARWPAVLAAAGFDPSAPAVFVAEGLTWYLPGRQSPCCWTRRRASRRRAAGSAPAWSARSPRANLAAAPYFALAAARGARRQFGTDDPGGFLAAHGWQAGIRDMYAVARSLGRWPPPGVPDDVAGRAAAASPNWFISATRFPEHGRGPVRYVSRQQEA